MTFKNDEQIITSGLTLSQGLAISSIESWIRHHDIQKLYNRFPFIDKHKRSLVEIRDSINSRFPELPAYLPIELEVRGIDYDLISALKIGIVRLIA